MKNQEIDALFESFASVNCLIIGDVMVDAYLWGNVNRISPEAPVPVFEVKKRENRLGGAANVALNIKALGANPILCGVVGNDVKGELFKELVENEGMSSVGLIIDNSRPTISKTRIISGSQHILRVDEEELANINTDIEEKFLANVLQIIQSTKIDVIIFEDYDKGLLNRNMIQTIVKLAKQNNIVTCVDPKKNNFNDYDGVDLFKPNFKEFVVGLKSDIKKSELDQLQKLAHAFGESKSISNIMITLSELGVFFNSKEDYYHVPAQIRNISDVSGAGDTVISIASLALSKGVSAKNIALLSNLSGGLVCEEVGVVPINKTKLVTEFKKLFN